MPSPIAQKKSVKITRGESSLEHTKEASMGPKLIVALILSIIVFTIEPTRAFAIPFAILAFAIVFVIEGVRIVPQQNAWVVERLGRYHETLEPGLRIIVPFVDRVGYKHSLKEVPFDVTRAGVHHKGQHATGSGRIGLLPGHRPAPCELRYLRLHHGHHATRPDHAAL
jgi:SPFH domain / Band 7 family